MEDKDLIGSRVYCCFKCRNVVALHDDIVDKYLVAGKKGRAFLFSTVMNIVEGTASNRHLITGVHLVKDVFCSDCQEYLGWKYEKVYSEQHKYKEHKFAICKRKICKAVDAPSYLFLKYHCVSFNTSSNASPGSSDLDTESTIGEFQGKEGPKQCRSRSNMLKTWCITLFLRYQTDTEIEYHYAASFGHFLAVETSELADEHRKSHSLIIYGHEDVILAHETGNRSHFFVGGHVPPTQFHGLLPIAKEGAEKEWIMETVVESL